MPLHQKLPSWPPVGPGYHLFVAQRRQCRLIEGDGPLGVGNGEKEVWRHWYARDPPDNPTGPSLKNPSRFSWFGVKAAAVRNSYLLPAVLLAGCHSAAPPTPPPTASPTATVTATRVALPPHSLRMINKKSGKIIGVDGGSREATAMLVLWDDEDKVDQRWNMTLLPPEQHVSNPATRAQFRNVGSGFFIGARFQTHLNGCQLCQYDQPAVFETWEMEPVESGYYHLRNRSSGKVMAVEGGSVEKGAKIIQWDMTPTAEDQKWKMEE